MYTKILTAAVLSLGLGTAAIAQSSDPSTADTAETNSVSPGDGEMGSSRMFDWDDEMAGAFFSDPEMTTMRSEEEITTNFSAMTEEQQAAVRENCEDSQALEQQENEGLVQVCEFINQM